jgi:hypothetical protein
MNIFEQIREDHEVQRTLIKDLISTEGDTQNRKYIYNKLKHHLKVHADAEERYFYKPLFGDDLTQDQARHSVAEHQEIDELLEKLDDTEMDNSAWIYNAGRLQARVLHHLEEEEKQMFHLAGKALDSNAKKELASSYREMMDNEIYPEA